jgi:hypothetical protein
LHGRGRSTGRRGGAVLTSEDFSFRGFLRISPFEDFSFRGLLRMSSFEKWTFHHRILFLSNDFISFHKFESKLLLTYD